jgi:hypothetical protein
MLHRPSLSRSRGVLWMPCSQLWSFQHRNQNVAKISGAPQCRQKAAGTRRNSFPNVKRVGPIVCGDRIVKYCYRKVATRISIRALVCRGESFAIATKTVDNSRFHRSMSSEVTTRMKPWCVLCFSDDLQKVFIL